MKDNMFCCQCEQTVGGKCCSIISGICGKSAKTAGIQDELIGALIGLADCLYANSQIPSRSTIRLAEEALFATMTNVNFDDETLLGYINRIHQEKRRVSIYGKRCFDYDLKNLWRQHENTSSLKTLVLFGLKGMAAYAYQADELGYHNEAVDYFFFKALRSIAYESDTEMLMNLVYETGNMNFQCMEMLERANTATFGIPTPTKVPLLVQKGPFIVVSGHDYKVLHKLLEETKYTEINIYTHGEMLPAHAFPLFKKYENLRGNFGTAWQNQQKEFENIPAPIVFTTNCIMPPKSSYKDRVFTTGAIHYPDTVHIDETYGFSEVIKKAKELGGYSEHTVFTGINGGKTVTTGWSHKAILNYEDKLVDGIRNGSIGHIFVVGGCDGARVGRNYYTEFVKNTPDNSVILTMGCGKYRFNDLDLGSTGGFPRIMDLGQCNDAYGAIILLSQVARALNLEINDLPVSFVLSWYEQKAIAVLLTLLSLNVKDIMIGPSMPAFVSKDIMKILSAKYGIRKITNIEDDINESLNKNLVFGGKCYAYG